LGGPNVSRFSSRPNAQLRRDVEGGYWSVPMTFNFPKHAQVARKLRKTPEFWTPCLVPQLKLNIYTSENISSNASVVNKEFMTQLRNGSCYENLNFLNQAGRPRPARRTRRNNAESNCNMQTVLRWLDIL